MKCFYPLAQFLLGGSAYVGLELLWRGRSHASMFFAGGTCFLLLGKIDRTGLPLPLKTLAGAGAVTAVELVAGLLVNRSYTVWDYRHMPMNFRGQICLPYSLLWIPVSTAGLLLHHALDRR